MKYICTIFTIFIQFWTSISLAQNGDNNVKTVQIQPIIMIIPYAKDGEDLRKVMEADISYRVAVSKVSEAFDNRGFSTRDFIATLKAVTTDGAYTVDNQRDLKSQIIEFSGADIYVEVEVNTQITPSGNSVRLILKAYDAYTSMSLANKTGSSGQFFTNDFSRLVERCLKYNVSQLEGQTEMLEAFLNMMNEKFGNIVKNGRTLKMSFKLSQESIYTFDDEFGDTKVPLSTLIEDWIADHAEKNQYTPPNATGKLVSFDGVKIPLRDEKGRAYTPLKFAEALRKYCNSLSSSNNPTTKLKVIREIRGGTIYFTIQ